MFAFSVGPKTTGRGQQFFKNTKGQSSLKWLAVECIEKGIYSHKSDVWSFGVTIWELLTYGKRPVQVSLSQIVNRYNKMTITTITIKNFHH